MTLCGEKHAIVVTPARAMIVSLESYAVQSVDVVGGTCAASSPDGSQIVIGAEDGSAVIVNCENGSVQSTLASDTKVCCVFDQTTEKENR